jgi:SAM-dependent methyltransferase
MEHPAVYRLWQAPFVRTKFAPVQKHNDFSRIRRVLDVGCGPGTNTGQIPEHCQYLGLDINARYIEIARRRFGREFQVADVREYVAPPGQEFDFILINSLLHHLDNEGVDHILRQVMKQLTPDGTVNVIDLVMPPSPSIAQYLARSDRGDYPRPLDEWRRIFSDVFEPIVFEPFDVRGAGLALWNMVYFQGRARP